MDKSHTCEGYLYKLSSKVLVSYWKKKWFVLAPIEKLLLCYNKKTKTELPKVYDLKHCYLVTDPKLANLHSFSFQIQISGDKPFYLTLASDDSEDKEKWCTNLRKFIEQPIVDNYTLSFSTLSSQFSQDTISSTSHSPINPIYSSHDQTDSNHSRDSSTLSTSISPNQMKTISLKQTSLSPGLKENTISSSMISDEFIQNRNPSSQASSLSNPTYMMKCKSYKSITPKYMPVRQTINASYSTNSPCSIPITTTTMNTNYRSQLSKSEIIRPRDRVHTYSVINRDSYPIASTAENEFEPNSVSASPSLQYVSYSNMNNAIYNNAHYSNTIYDNNSNNNTNNSNNNTNNTNNTNNNNKSYTDTSYTIEPRLNGPYTNRLSIPSPRFNTVRPTSLHASSTCISNSMNNIYSEDATRTNISHPHAQRMPSIRTNRTPDVSRGYALNDEISQSLATI